VTTLLIVAAALALDALLGEPTRFHPLVGFGRLTAAVERRWYGRKKWRGTLAVLVLITPLAIISAFASATSAGPIFDAVLLYLAIGWRSLHAHARPVRDALRANQLPQARQRVGMMVSRDTTPMQTSDVSKAAVESVLENGNDAVFGALFWFIVAGAPGAVIYRLANTLDAMWGYRNERYLEFGWAAARLDDVLNFVPARLTALTYAIVGHTATALRCWIDQARQWDSPNAGPVMASGAGSLRVALGGPASYHGTLENRPALGSGPAPQADDIDRALRLVDRSVIVWLIALSGGLLLVRTF
jgi:adenosylcobinamide-phosphate synthase